MSFIQLIHNPIIDLRAQISLSAGADLDVQKTFRAGANLSFHAFANLSQTNLLQGTSNITLSANGFLRIDDEPNQFISAGANLSLNSNLDLTTARIFQANANLKVSANASLTNQQAARGDALFNVQIVPSESVSNYQKCKTRFSANGTEIKIRSFRLDYPAKSIGSKLSVELAYPVRGQFDQNTNFKFEYNLGAGWRTVLDTAKLDSESVSSRFFDDRVNLDISAPLSDKLGLSPRKTKIYYDPFKTTVDVEDQPDVLRDTYGAAFPISKQAVNNLSLSFLLNKAFVEGCGFGSVVTNLPDYKITRADFSTGQTFKESVGGFIGMFEPVFFEADNILYILDTSNVLPSGFTPRSIGASKFTNFSSNAQKRTILDGYDVSFADSEGDYYTQRQTQKTETSGTFGTSDYSETDILTTIREYRNFDNPNVILRTEIKDEQRITYDSVFNVIGQETLTRNFNSSGRLASIVKQTSARVPDLNNSGNLLLQNLRGEETRLFYKPNPKNTREILTNRIEKRISGLIAIDTENTYFGQAFEQEYLKAHENGNLTENMTSRFGAISTVIETFETDNKGQTEIKRQVIDHIRGVSAEAQDDVRSGENSYRQFQQANTVRVWRTGANRSADKGGAFASFSAGELPSRLAIALAERKLIKQTARNQTGIFDLAGIDLSLRRGSSVKILDRWNSSFGNFLIEGLSITGTFGQTNSIQTSIQAQEI